MSNSDVSSIASLPEPLPAYSRMPPMHPYKTPPATPSDLSQDDDLYEGRIYARREPVVDHEDRCPDVVRECSLLGEACAAVSAQMYGLIRALWA